MQDKTLLHGRWHRWITTRNGCWTSWGRMKPTFHCSVTWIFKIVISGRHQILVSTTANNCFRLLWLGPIYFVQHCPLSSSKICTITAELYLALLLYHIVHVFQKSNALPLVTFMQDGATYSPTTLAEFKNAIRQPSAAIEGDMLYSAAMIMVRASFGYYFVVMVMLSICCYKIKCIMPC